ncbi:MAG: transposase [Candidatus Cloacimonadota bacterium]|nr:transposase [Candidatus Cloacimonadota bacterium]
MIHSRRSIRLQSYDYTANGAYFITLCTHKREHFLGEIINGEMKISVIGKIVSEKWFDIPNHHNVKLGEFIIMPNHIHGIIWIISNDTVGAFPGMTEEKVGAHPGVTDKLSSKMTDEKERARQGEPRRGKIHQDEPQSMRKFGEPQSGSLSMIINQFKGSVKRWCNKNDHKWFRWQRNFYEHIIRNDKDLFNTTDYIKKNTINWSYDEYREKAE